MKTQEAQIYCPRCSYRPRAEDRWDCMPSCGTHWHTFWTRGVCPGCGYCWQKTQCPGCGELSPHEHWYHQPQNQPAQPAQQPVENTGTLR